MLDIFVIIVGGPLLVVTSGTPPPPTKACVPSNVPIGATIDTMPRVSIGCPLTMLATVGKSPLFYVNTIVKLPMLELLALALSSPSANMSQSPSVFKTWLM